jgi:hypothetical protein
VIRHAVLFLLCASTACLYAQGGDLEDPITRSPDHPITRSSDGPISPEAAYQSGIALAQLERWDEAHAALLAGSRLAPSDKRFLIELAGVAFKQKKLQEAIAYLRRALRLDPGDAYGNDFLATLYFLQGNLEAAVKYWNRCEKPRIQAVRSEPAPRVSPALLDHAFVFAPASTLTLAQLQASDARLRSLEIFPAYRVDLAARPEGEFDAVFRAQELNGWGSTRVEALLRTFRGLPFQEITPEYFNLGRRAINLSSLIRWDSDKRRLAADLSAPLWQDPRWHFLFTGDLRNENWNVAPGVAAGGVDVLDLNMRREAVAAEISRLAGTRLKWSLGAELSHRDYRNVQAAVSLPPELLARGYQLKQTAQLGYVVWRSPEHRFTVSSEGLSDSARLWSNSAAWFDKLQGSLGAHWLPRGRGDDFETDGQLRAGKTFGQPSFDELFMLGLERDNDLWMRAHIGTHDGRKGSAPLGRNYFVSNWETDKNLYSNGLVTVKLGPFVDTGKITDPSPGFGSQKWLWDTGVQLKLKVLNVAAVFSYGKDLRTGNNAFYSRVGK